MSDKPSVGGILFFMAQVVKNAKVGSVIGRLKIVSIDKIWAANYRYKKVANCKCECGNLISMPLPDFGNKRSCGCLVSDAAHGKSHTKVWAAWQKMKSRCYNKNCPKYPSYGGRGLVVCEGLQEFKHFYKIMGDPPTKLHSNDRIDNNKSYTCGICDECISKKWVLNIHWATPKEQSQNQRTNRLVTYNGKTMCLVEACRIAGLSYKAVFGRITKCGWDIETALNTPIGVPHSYKKIKNAKT